MSIVMHNILKKILFSVSIFMLPIHSFSTTIQYPIGVVGPDGIVVGATLSEQCRALDLQWWNVSRQLEDAHDQCLKSNRKAKEIYAGSCSESICQSMHDERGRARKLAQDQVSLCNNQMRAHNQMLAEQRRQVEVSLRRSREELAQAKRTHDTAQTYWGRVNQQTTQSEESRTYKNPYAPTLIQSGRHDQDDPKLQEDFEKLHSRTQPDRQNWIITGIQNTTRNQIALDLQESTREVKRIADGIDDFHHEVADAGEGYVPNAYRNPPRTENRREINKIPSRTFSDVFEGSCSGERTYNSPKICINLTKSKKTSAACAPGFQYSTSKCDTAGASGYCTTGPLVTYYWIPKTQTASDVCSQQGGVWKIF